MALRLWVRFDIILVGAWDPWTLRQLRHW